MDRRLWGIAAAVLALLVGAYLASPLVAVDALRAAARSGDRDRLEQLADFPAVRAHLKEDLSARLLVKLRSDPELTRSPLAGLGLILGPAIVDRAIDAYVTPDAVAAMIRSGKAPQPGMRPEEGGAVQAGGDRAGDDARARNRPRVRMAYADLDHFRVTLSRADGPDQTLGLLLQRRDLFWWRLTRIELPQDKTASAPPSRESTPSQETTPAGEMQPPTPQSPEPPPSSPPPTPQSQARTLAQAQALAQAEPASPPAPAQAQPRPLGPPQRTSYDCARARSFADVTVCHDAQLAAQDRRLPALYENALARDAPGRVEEEARAAAVARRACQTRECLSRWYGRRLAALAIWEGN